MVDSEKEAYLKAMYPTPVAAPSINTYWPWQKNNEPINPAQGLKIRTK